MSWPFLFFAALSIGIGVEALILSCHRVELPQRETDKSMFGDPPPRLSAASRQYLESRFLVRNGGSTQVLGVLFIVLGLVLGAVGVGWL